MLLDGLCLPLCILACSSAVQNSSLALVQWVEDSWISLDSLVRPKFDCPYKIRKGHEKYTQLLAACQALRYPLGTCRLPMYLPMVLTKVLINVLANLMPAVINSINCAWLWIYFYGLSKSLCSRGYFTDDSAATIMQVWSSSFCATARTSGTAKPTLIWLLLCTACLRNMAQCYHRPLATCVLALGSPTP